jgi:hypothetical protein
LSGAGADGRRTGFVCRLLRDLALAKSRSSPGTPTRLTQLVRAAEIAVTVSFLKHWSAVADERFSQWAGGPSLVLAWKF